MRNEGKKKVKARKNGSRLLATLGVAREGNGVRRGIRIKIMIMNDLTHLLRTEAGQAFAMICRHGGLDGYLRLFPGFPILGYSRNFEIFGYSKIFEEFRGLGKKMGGNFDSRNSFGDPPSLKLRRTRATARAKWSRGSLARLDGFDPRQNFFYGASG
jgi:hypothetical protein